jgi:putative ABC transport system permease protein
MSHMQSFLRDLRYGARMLGRNRGFTAAALVTLALAIGANTAIFSVTSALLLQPFPYRQPDQLASISVHDDDRDAGGTLMRYELIRDRARTLEIAAYTNDNFNLTGIGEPVQVAVARVTPNFFSLLGVQPELGRSFSVDEGRVTGKPVAMLSYALWQSRFNSNPGIVGRTVDLDGSPTTIIGVLPAGARFPFVGQADIWSPRYFEITLMPQQRLRMGVGYLSYLARLRPGATLAAANAELAVLNGQYLKQNPATIPDASPTIAMTAVPLRDSVVGDLRGKLWVLTGAVAVLLLVGCANVASLMLSRALARRRELAVRAALGAGRQAIVRQLLTESLVLALVAGGLGILLGWAGIQALAAWGSVQLPDGIPVGMDWRVVMFALGASLLTALLTGILPAVQVTREDPNATLRDEGRGFSVSRRRGRIGSVLVVGQVALSLLLLICAGLLVRSFGRLLRVDPGFDAGNVLTMEVSLPTEKYAKPEQQIAFFDETLRRISSLPGVRGAAISAAAPLSIKRITPMLPEGQPEVPLAQRPFLDIEAVSPQWFTTMRVPLLSGRGFADADDEHAPKVVIVNETFARRFWPGQNAVGKHVTIGRWPEPSEVVGIAADVHNRGLAQEPLAQIYLPFPQLPWGDMNLLVRTAVPPMSVAGAVRAQIAAVDPDQPVTAVRTVDELMDISRAQPRFTMLLLAGFSGTALVLAAIGLAAVLAWSVVQRQHEMAIRLALGADRRDIRWLVVRDGLVLAGSGIAMGIVAGLLVTRLMSSVLYKTSARDLSTFAIAPLALFGIAWLASYLPARRATDVDPLDTLRAG